MEYLYFSELLSQLNGVRRNAQLLQQVVTNDTTINEIQDKLQQERNKAQEIRQKMVSIVNSITSLAANLIFQIIYLRSNVGLQLQT